MRVETLNQEELQRSIPGYLLEQSAELVRGAEVLPGGLEALAQRLFEAKQQRRPLRVKLGVDPTSTDLHLGHAVVFRKLRCFQEFGHQVVLIIGGFTAQIGDPSGRTATRPALSAESVAANARTYLEQMGVILDLDKTEVVNNADWLAPLSLNEVLKLAGSVTVNQLLAKEAFGDRLEKQLPVGLHELFYPLLQGYDSVAVRADIELGGTDQRFNILQGRQLQSLYGLKSPQLAMLLPLLEGTDGVQKMSKSYNNYIGLKETPSDMFGKCMRVPDQLIVKYFELTTTFAGTQIDAIAAELKEGANPKDLKERLGHQIVRQYHGQSAADATLDEWKRVHSERQIPSDMPLYAVPVAVPLFKLLVESKLAAGSGEAKRLVGDGAVRLDGEQEKDPNREISVSPGVQYVLQVGRRKFIRLVND